MFKENFLLLLLNVDLNNINDFIYVNWITLTKNIKKINKTIVKLEANKTFKTN